MDSRFADVVESLQPSYQRLMAMESVAIASLPKGAPTAGIYLLSEGRQHVHVGRSNDIRGRLGRHSRPGATHQQASLAFRLAQEATGNASPEKTKMGSRAALMENPDFAEAFKNAKSRIRSMDVRYVEEADPIRQTILEVYVAVALETPYNDFDNH